VIADDLYFSGQDADFLYGLRFQHLFLGLMAGIGFALFMVRNLLVDRRVRQY